MIPHLQEKYEKLTPAQKDIFVGYGLRQVKHFVEISLPKIEAALPPGAFVQGINAEGKVQAIDPIHKKNYIWISDSQWQERPIQSENIDLKEDAIAVWTVFELKSYELIDLSHIHRDFLNQLSVKR